MGCDIHIVVEQRFEDRWVGRHAFDSWMVRTPASAKANDAAMRKVDAEHTAGFRDGYMLSMTWGGNLARDRNYELFTKLANVRADNDEGPKPKGVPDDASDLTRLHLEHWGNDAHSKTYYSLREALEIFMPFYLPQELLEPHPSWIGCQLFGIDLDGDDETELDQYRVIFWFDN